MAENTENTEKTPEELAVEKSANTSKPTAKAATSKASKPAAAKPAVKEPTAKPATEKTGDVAELDEAKAVAKRCDVKVIHKNTKGEYFTSLNLAVSSESGFKDKVKTFEF